MVAVTEQRGKDGQGGSVVEDGAKGNSRWLDWWKVYGCSKLLAVRSFSKLDGAVSVAAPKSSNQVQLASSKEAGTTHSEEWPL